MVWKNSAEIFTEQLCSSKKSAEFFTELRVQPKVQLNFLLNMNLKMVFFGDVNYLVVEIMVQL